MEHRLGGESFDQRPQATAPDPLHPQQVAQVGAVEALEVSLERTPLVAQVRYEAEDFPGVVPYESIRARKSSLDGRTAMNAAVSFGSASSSSAQRRR